MGEIKRIVSQRFFIVLAALLLLNTVLLMSFHMKNKAESDVYDDLVKLTVENKRDNNTYCDAYELAWKQYMEENQINRDTVTEAIKSAKALVPQKAEYVDGYRSSVEEKMNFSKSVMYSDFHSEKSFERINLYKTYVDLSKVKDTEVVLSNGRWLETLYEYEYNHIFIVVVLVFCVYGFFTERKNGLYYIIHTCACGRAGLLIKRVLFLFTGSFVVSALFYFESSVILLKIYGGVEGLFLPAASDELFFLTAGNLSRLGFVFFQAAVSAVAAFALVLLLWVILMFFYNVNIGLSAYLLLLGAEILAHALIHAKALLRVFKYVNLYYLLYPGRAIKYYNWGYDFGVVELLESTLVAVAVVAAVSFALHFYMSTRTYFSGKNNLFERAVNCIMTWIMRGIGVLPPVFKEVYKILVSQKAAVVLAVLLYMVSQIHIGVPVLYDGQKVAVSRYYEKTAGMEYSPELESEYAVFEKEYEEFLTTVDVNNQSNQGIIQNRQNALQEMRANADYLKKLKEEGTKAVVLMPYEYDAAFGAAQSDNQMWLALINILAVIVISAGFISYEKSCNVNILVVSCRNRREWLVRKMGVNVLLIGIFELAAYGIYYGRLFKVYSLEGLTAPLKSLPMFEGSIVNPSVIGFLMLDLFVRFLVLAALSAVVCYISKYVKLVYCAITGLVITIPQFLYMIGFEVLEKWSIGRYVAYLPVANDASQPTGIYYIFVIAVMAMGIYLYGSFIKKGMAR